MLIDNLHALRHREGMGKRAFLPQGVGTPVLFGQRGCFRFPATPSAARLASLVGRASRPFSTRFPYFRRSTSAPTKSAKTTEITPFMVKKAALRLERSPGLTRECS
jgi:hypothetical protein